MYYDDLFRFTTETVSILLSGLKRDEMTNLPSWFAEPSRVDEPRAVQDYAAVLSQVASVGTPIIVRRNGEDLAAIVHPDHLEIVRECLRREEVERLAASIDWERAKGLRPPQSWFDDDEDNPFEPENESNP